MLPRDRGRAKGRKWGVGEKHSLDSGMELIVNLTIYEPEIADTEYCGNKANNEIITGLHNTRIIDR